MVRPLNRSCRGLGQHKTRLVLTHEPARAACLSTATLIAPSHSAQGVSIFTFSRSKRSCIAAVATLDLVADPRTLILGIA